MKQQWTLTTTVVAAIAVILAVSLAFTVPALVDAQSKGPCQQNNRIVTFFKDFVLKPPPQPIQVPPGADAQLTQIIVEANARQVSQIERLRKLKLAKC